MSRYCYSNSYPQAVSTVTINQTLLALGTATGEGQIVTEEFQEPTSLTVGGLYVDLSELVMAGYDVVVNRNGNEQSDSLYSLSTVGGVTRITFVAGEEFVAEDLISVRYAYLVT